MGIIVLLLTAAKHPEWAMARHKMLWHEHTVALWVILSCHAAIAPRSPKMGSSFFHRWRSPRARLPLAVTCGPATAGEGALRGFGRSLRAVVDLPKLGERQVIVDCDVIQADGGTRTAAISGGWVALRVAVDRLLESKAIPADPIRTQVAAVSCGIHKGSAVLDLDYDEDSTAGSDGNFVLTADGAIVEAQLTAEGETFDEEGLLRLLRLARIGCSEIFAAQLKATGR